MCHSVTYNMQPPGFIHVVTYCKVSFKGGNNVPSYAMLRFLIHSPINRELYCFHIWAMACNTIVSMGLIPSSLLNYPISVIPRSEIARPQFLSFSPLSVPPSFFPFLYSLSFPVIFVISVPPSFLPSESTGSSPQLLIAIVTDVIEYFTVIFSCSFLMVSNV